jgi:hypothetical protein
MIRISALVVVLAVLGVGTSTRRVAWPFRAKVTDLHGQPVAFRAITQGGELILEVGQRSLLSRPLVPTPELRPLASAETLQAMTPAEYPLRLTNGPVVFFSAESLRVVVGGNPFGTVNPVTAQGRRLTVRLSHGWVAIESR